MNHSSSDNSANSSQINVEPSYHKNGLVLPPLSLYVHIPWCVKKCPYCDFNSHQQKGSLPIESYVSALKNDLISQLDLIQGRTIRSIFFGGGTPSLFPSGAIASILSAVRELTHVEKDAEVTLETNPGTAEYSRFDQLLKAGVNRLSFGAQSFDDRQLASLGRIHSSEEINKAIEKAKAAGYTNFNIDLMHGLQGQTTRAALRDIELALRLEPTHLSWYQLTIEPNTTFYSQPPVLPDDQVLCDIYDRGRELLCAAGFEQYEVSAYARQRSDNAYTSIHNLNYWQFGDYLAIGAGAHGKVTNPEKNEIRRFNRTRNPKDYLSQLGFGSTKAKHGLAFKTIPVDERPLEFMMNALRLLNGVETRIFVEHTGLTLKHIESDLKTLRSMGWLTNTEQSLRATEAGHYYLNKVLEHFVK